ncbi:MAG TPA: cytochrome c oxidase subunit II [Terriglobales bacterium]|nr:cytochrome c oxidase subunit II [Terriglobales bacterium]
MLPNFFPLFPESASTMAPRVDALFYFILGVTIFFTTLVFLLILVFSIRYRKERHPVPVQIHGSIPLEIFWTIVPLGIAMIIFAWGGILFFQEMHPPKTSMDIYGVGKQWMWKFQHPGGQREIDNLHVPVGRPVRMTLISQDVIHDFFVPAFRAQYDVLPGRYTTVWFEATKPGVYHLFCNQYCGTNHSAMVGEVYAMSPDDYEAWLRGSGAFGSLATLGQNVFASMGCPTCHTGADNARAPNLYNLYNTTVRTSENQTVTADASYIRESILNPSAKIVYGYQNIMPTFQGQLNEDEMIELIEYIKSLTYNGQLLQLQTNTQQEPPVNLNKIQQGIDVMKPGTNTIVMPRTSAVPVTENAQEPSSKEPAPRQVVTPSNGSAAAPAKPSTTSKPKAPQGEQQQ